MIPSKLLPSLFDDNLCTASWLGNGILPDTAINMF